MAETQNFEAFLEDILAKEESDVAQSFTSNATDPIKSIESETAAPRRNPFKFLDAFTPNDRDIFFGRDLEIKELYRAVFSHKICVVFGNSGAGKTSLVQCGLFAGLKPEKTAYFVIRSAIQPLLSVKNDCIRKIGVYDPAKDLFHNMTHAVQSLKKTLILFFDQFEELFILQPVGIRKEVALLLKQIVGSDMNIRIILGIREEYFARLIEFERVAPDILTNRTWVRNMSAMQAEAVIINPCRVCDVLIEADVPKQVVEDVSQAKEGIELPFIQIVMDKLYHQATERDPSQPHIRAEDYHIRGGVKNILSDFIEDQIQDMPEPEQARQVLKALITSQGTKQILKADDIAGRTADYGEAIQPEEIQTLLRDLVDQRILREDPDNGLYELRHDFLAQTVREWMTGIEQELVEVRETLNNRFREYQARGTLLDDSVLKYIQPYETRLRLKPEQTRFIEASKNAATRKHRRFMVIIGAAVAMFVLVVSGLGIFGYMKSIEAEQKAKELAQEQIKTESKLVESKHNFGIALLEKAKIYGNKNNFNLAKIYSFYALKNFAPEFNGPEKASAIGNIISMPSYPIIYSYKVCSKEKKVTTMAFSCDGTEMALGLDDNTIQIWDTETWHIKTHLKGHLGTINDLSFSSDGTKLVSGSNDKSVRIWDNEKGKLQTTLEGHSEPVISVCFSPTGKILASGSSDKKIRLWNISNKTMRKEIEGDISKILKFSSDGNVLASIFKQRSIRLYDTKKYKQFRRKFQRHRSDVLELAFPPDDSILASASSDNTIVIWDWKTSKRWNIKSRLEGHTGKVTSLTFSSDSNILVSGSSDKTIRFWDSKLGKTMIILDEHSNPIKDLEFFRNSKVLISASPDGAIKMWDVEPFKYSGIFKDEKLPVKSVSFSPDGHMIASGSSTEIVHLWDVETRKERAFFEGHTQPVRIVKFSFDSRMLATGSLDCTVRLWDVKTQKMKAILSGHGSEVNTISFSPNNLFVATGGSSDQTIRIWKVESGKLINTLEGHTNIVRDVSYSPKGNMIASSASDRTIKLWDAKSGKNIETFEGHDADVYSISFSPDGKTLASGSWDKTIRLWDVKSGKMLRKIEGHNGDVYEIAFPPMVKC